MDSLFEGITSSLYSRGGQDHHHQSRAEKQKHCETTEVGVTEGGTWRITWGSVKTGGKHQLGCPNVSSSKAPGGQQRASVSIKQMPAALYRVLRWAQRVTRPSPVISVCQGAAGVERKTGLRWLHLPQISRNTQERSRKGWGHRPGESGGCDNSYIVRAGMRKLRIPAGENGAGGGTQGGSILISLLINCPSGQSSQRNHWF